MLKTSRTNYLAAYMRNVKNKPYPLKKSSIMHEISSEVFTTAEMI